MPTEQTVRLGEKIDKLDEMIHVLELDIARIQERIIQLEAQIRPGKRDLPP